MSDTTPGAKSPTDGRIENDQVEIPDYADRAIRTRGTHNPEHVRGETAVTVTSWPSKPIETCVGLTLMFPNGTNSSLDLSPAQARSLGDHLLTAAEEMEPETDD